jgi:hypothetical protein
LTPLIDGDVIRYELGFSGEYDEIDENTNEKIHHIREWEFVQELVDNKIKFISEEAGGVQPPVLFLTGSSLSTRIINRTNRYSGSPDIRLDVPFREVVAVTKPYKGTRKGDKPFHFDNITAYLLANYDCRVSNGLEADDLMAMEQFNREDTIICTRDKDLRMVPGWHYGWECGKQPSFGPELVDARGWLKLNHKKELKGVGLKFFFAQMLTGDTVDNIPGCKRVGDVGAMKLLEPCNTKREHELAVIAAYQNAYPDNWKDMIEEQSKLLWMVRELDDKGQPIFYEWKYD